MTVVAFVGETDHVQPIVAWAGKFAAALHAELVLFYVPHNEHAAVFPADSLGDEEFLDERHAALSAAVEGIVRTKRARKGRIPRHAVSIRRVATADSVADTISRIRVESPDLFIAAASCAPTSNGKSVSQQVAAKLSCDAIVLFNNGKRITKPKRIVVVTSDGAHDKSAVGLASQAAQTLAEGVTVVGIEASVGQGAIKVQERQLRSLLRDLDLGESSRLGIKAVLTEDWVKAAAEGASECELLLIGANKEKKVSALLEATPHATVGVFRRAARLSFGRQKEHAAWLLPQINPIDYADLYEQLQAGSRWNSDFIFMLSAAAGIATLGLLQSSTAVVIGSMLLAPLMTPMIGMGLALNQGNAKLAQSSLRAIGRGFFAALAISVFLALVTPGSDLTPEVLARTEPNILDLLIAILSGSAAAYALARPSLAGTIAGVAIATALVPPLCSAGISLAYRQFPESIGALSLLVANVLAIILAAAGTFRAMGLGALTAGAPRRFWVRHVVAGLIFSLLVITIPLAITFMRQSREGKNAPIAFALTNDVREILLEHIEKKPGVEIIFAGRSGVHRESDPVDVGIILASEFPLPRSEADELAEIIRSTLQNPELQVKVACVAQGWDQEIPEGSVAGVPDGALNHAPD